MLCICKNQGIYSCAKCKSKKYCSKKCQSCDWSTHKWNCHKRFLKCPEPKSISGNISDIISKFKKISSYKLFCKYCYIRRKFKEKFKYFEWFPHKIKNSVLFRFYAISSILNQKLINCPPISPQYIVLLVMMPKNKNTIYMKISNTVDAFRELFLIDQRHIVYGDSVDSDFIGKIDNDVDSNIITYLNWKTFNIVKTIYIKDIPNSPKIDYQMYPSSTHRIMVAKLVHEKFKKRIIHCCNCRSLYFHKKIYFVPKYNNTLCEKCIFLIRTKYKDVDIGIKKLVVNNKIQFDKNDFLFDLLY